MIFCYIISFSSYYIVLQHCPSYLYHWMCIYMWKMQKCFDILWWIDILMLGWGMDGREGGECYNGHTMCSHWQKENNISWGNMSAFPQSWMLISMLLFCCIALITDDAMSMQSQHDSTNWPRSLINIHHHQFLLKTY